MLGGGGKLSRCRAYETNATLADLRKLAAILAADVVGYSRLMAIDEAGTLSALKQHRQTVFDPCMRLPSIRPARRMRPWLSSSRNRS
jgi:class 3 adenylate cyclase